MELRTDARALYERARRPAIRILFGGALIMPAAAMMSGGQLQDLTETGLAAAVEEQRTTDAAVRAWSQRLLEHERSLVVQSFAKEFGVPVTLARDIHAAALEEKVSPRVAFGLVRAESSFRTRVVSPVGAVGLTQLLPSTARWLVPGTTRSDLMKPETNLRVGFKYLRHLLDKYDSDEKLALTAYNRGPGTVDKVLKRGGDPDNGYAEKVLTGRSARHVALMNRKFGS
ncbi:MAG: lytic transglycosylase domain-containing protein [Gemmatimonadota bacterium]